MACIEQPALTSVKISSTDIDLRLCHPLSPGVARTFHDDCLAKAKEQDPATPATALTARAAADSTRANHNKSGPAGGVPAAYECGASAQPCDGTVKSELESPGTAAVTLVAARMLSEPVIAAPKPPADTWHTPSAAATVPVMQPQQQGNHDLLVTGSTQGKVTMAAVTAVPVICIDSDSDDDRPQVTPLAAKIKQENSRPAGQKSGADMGNNSIRSLGNGLGTAVVLDSAAAPPSAATAAVEDDAGNQQLPVDFRMADCGRNILAAGEQLIMLLDHLQAPDEQMEQLNKVVNSLSCLQVDQGRLSRFWYDYSQLRFWINRQKLAKVKCALQQLLADV